MPSWHSSVGGSNTMSRTVTEVQLEALLVQLKFRQIAAVPGSHKAFRHDATDATVVLGWAPPSKQLNPAVIAGVKKLLDEKGVIDGGAFDRDLERLVDHLSTRSERGIYP